MKHLLVSTLAACVLSASLPAQAQNRACVMEATITFMGQTVYSKDCMQAAPKESEAALRRTCEEVAQMSAAMGGKPARITYLKQCPMPAQGICRGYLRTGRDAYYYARSADEVARLPTGCAQGGGRWSPGR